MSAKAATEVVENTVNPMGGKATNTEERAAIRSKDDADKAIDAALAWIGDNTRQAGDENRPPGKSEVLATILNRSWAMYGPKVARRNVPLLVPKIGVLRKAEVYAAALRLGDLWAMGSGEAAGLADAWPGRGAVDRVDAWIADANTQIATLNANGYEGRKAQTVDAAKAEVQAEKEAAKAAEEPAGKTPWGLIAIGIGFAALLGFAAWDASRD